MSVYATDFTPIKFSTYYHAGTVTLTTGTTTTLTITGGLANSTPLVFVTAKNTTAAGLVATVKYHSLVSKTAGTFKLSHGSGVTGAKCYYWVTY